MGIEIDKEEERRQKMNEALKRDAQAGVTWLTLQAANGYSGALSQQETKLNEQLGKEGSATKAFIVDPAAFDTALALGFTPAQAAAAGLGLPPPLAGSTEETRMKQVADLMMYPHQTKMGMFTSTPAPHAIPIVEGAACYIVPADNRSDFIHIKKLSPDDESTFINLHEAWHCRDNDAFKGLTQEQIGKAYQTENIADLPKDAGVFRAFAVRNRMESLADVGGVGDMIRNGYDPSIIGSVRAWRKEGAWDAAHHTLPALDGLKEKIDKMGVDNFRKLSDADARKLYQQVIDEHALSEKSVSIIHEDKHSMLLNFVNDNLEWVNPDVRKARQFERSREDTANGPNLIQKTMASIGRVWSGQDKKDAAVVAAVNKWDAMAELKDTAFKNDGKITPATLVTAYRDMQDKLCEDTRKHPENRQLNEEKMNKLREVFVAETPKTDFAGENLKRGVKIELVEPALKSFIEKPKPAPVPLAVGRSKPAM